VEITPFVGQEPVTATSVVVRVNPDDRARAEALVLRTGVIRSVIDQGGFTAAQRAAGQLKALVDEITEAKKNAKRPFTAVGKAIDDLASEVGSPVADEHKRVLSLLNDYVARLEAEAKEEQRKKEEVLQKQIAAQQQKLKAAQEAQRAAEETARKAEDEVARMQAQEDARRKAQDAEQAQLATEMAREISQIGEKPAKGLVTGGRVGHKYEFRLVNVQETIKAGAWRLLRWEIDHLACQDSCKAQLEINPDAEPLLPGIEVKRTINVSVRASARIE
jgi:hypothetical protein